jgi:hypothetical protein
LNCTVLILSKTSMSRHGVLPSKLLQWPSRNTKATKAEQFDARQVLEVTTQEQYQRSRHKGHGCHVSRYQSMSMAMSRSSKYGCLDMAGTLHSL